MIQMAKVEAVYLKKKGRFVVLAVQNLPVLPWIRSMVPSEDLQLDDRVKITIEKYVEIKPGGSSEKLQETICGSGSDDSKT